MVKSTTFGIFKSETKQNANTKGEKSTHTPNVRHIHIYKYFDRQTWSMFTRLHAHIKRWRTVTHDVDGATNNFISAINVWRCQFRIFVKNLCTCSVLIGGGDFWSWKVLDTIAEWLIFLSRFGPVRFGLVVWHAWLLEAKRRTRRQQRQHVWHHYFSLFTN